MRYVVFGLAAMVAGAVGFGGPAWAVPLTAGSSLVVDGATVTVLSCTGGGTACADGALVAASGPVAGVTFEGVSGALLSSPGALVDMTISYSVTAATPITSIGLDVGSGTGANGVSETLYDDSTGVPVGDGSATGVTAGTDTTVAMPEPTMDLDVTKDIKVGTFGGSVPSSLESVTQYFNGISAPAAPVPEPASVGLLGLGLAALACTRRSRRPRRA